MFCIDFLIYSALSIQTHKTNWFLVHSTFAAAFEMCVIVGALTRCHSYQCDRCNCRKRKRTAICSCFLNTTWYWPYKKMFGRLIWNENIVELFIVTECRLHIAHRISWFWILKAHHCKCHRRDECVQQCIAARCTPCECDILIERFTVFLFIVQCIYVNYNGKFNIFFHIFLCELSPSGSGHTFS